MDGSAFNHMFEGLDVALKLLAGLIITVPILIIIIIYLLVR